MCVLCACPFCVVCVCVWSTPTVQVMLWDGEVERGLCYSTTVSYPPSLDLPRSLASCCLRRGKRGEGWDGGGLARSGYISILNERATLAPL